MSWVENHEVSERLAAEAEAALHDGREDEAACLYAEAAEAEDKAVADLDPSSKRTLGITTVSAVSLRFKAARYAPDGATRANRFARAEQSAQVWLDHRGLPAFAEDQLRSLLLSIRTERRNDRGRQCVNRLHRRPRRDGAGSTS